MQRRSFLTLLGGAAAAWPIAARAQQRSAMPVVGGLHPASREYSARQLDAFRQGLAEAGYIEGRNVAIEHSFANGELDRLPILAAELVRRQVTVIAAIAGSDAARAARNATVTIPIVFSIGNDPVQVGLVSVLNRPGGNITGATAFTREVQGKRLAMFRELLPSASTIGTFTNPTSVVADLNLRDLEIAATKLGHRLLVLRVGRESEFETAFAELVRQGAGALFVNGSPFYSNRHQLIVAFALRNGIATIFPSREAVEAGGLMSYGASLLDSGRQAGIYAGRILKGERPGDLPVVQPTKFEFVLNLRTARALRVTIPPTLLAIADEVIE